jgi:allophanate hydrolase subunit 2
VGESLLEILLGGSSGYEVPTVDERSQSGFILQPDRESLDGFPVVAVVGDEDVPRVVRAVGARVAFTRQRLTMLS